MKRSSYDLLFLGDLFHLAGDKRCKMKILCALMALDGLFKIVPQVIFYMIVLEVLKNDIDLDRIWHLASIFIVLFAAFNLYNHVVMTASFRLGQEVAYDIRISIAERLKTLRLGYYIERPTGEINSTLGKYISRLESYIAHSLPVLILIGAYPLAAGVLFIIVDLRLALAAFSVLPLTVLIFLSLGRILERTVEEKEKALISMNSVIIEFVQGLPAIKLYSQESSRFTRYEAAVEEFRDTNLKSLAAFYLRNIVYLTVANVGMAVVIIAGLYLYLSQLISIASLIFFIIIGPSFFNYISAWIQYAYSKNVIGQSIKSIIKMLEEKPLLQPEKDNPLTRFDIELKGVSFSYGDRPVLKSIDLIIPEGSIAALVGPSGAGKTTLSNLIARFWDVDEGAVIIGGIDVRDLKTETLMSSISMVFQDPFLFDDTIKENIICGNRSVGEEDMIRAAERAKCHEFIEALPDGYDTRVGEKGIMLSGGERQRIAIARALLKDAPIVMLDEATAFVDPENERQIQEAISELMAGKTVVVIAHRLATVTDADLIAVMDGGRIAELGRHVDLLLAGGLYRRMWDIQSQVSSWKLT